MVEVKSQDATSSSPCSEAAAAVTESVWPSLRARPPTADRL